MKVKKILFFALLSVLLVGCENASEKDTKELKQTSQNVQKEDLSIGDEVVLKNDLKFSLNIEKGSFKEGEDSDVSYIIQSLHEKERTIEVNLPNAGEPKLYRESKDGKLVLIDSALAAVKKEIVLSNEKAAEFTFQSQHLISHNWSKEEGERSAVEKFYLEKEYLPKGTYVYQVTPAIEGYDIESLQIRFTIE